MLEQNHNSWCLWGKINCLFILEVSQKLLHLTDLQIEWYSYSQNRLVYYGIDDCEINEASDEESKLIFSLYGDCATCVLYSVSTKKVLALVLDQNSVARTCQLMLHQVKSVTNTWI